jgi:hypothetical protein
MHLPFGCGTNELPRRRNEMKYTDLLKDAAVIVRGKLLWKRFIDGTPLSNDLPFWMADFAAAAAAHEREECAKIAEIAEPYQAADLIRARGTT